MTQCKVKEISPTLFEIPELGHTVKIQKKPGRTLWLCSCQNHQKFCNENGWCFDKQLVLKHIILKKPKEKVDQLIELYSNAIREKLNINPLNFVEELEILRRML